MPFSSSYKVFSKIIPHPPNQVNCTRFRKFFHDALCLLFWHDLGVIIREKERDLVRKMGKCFISSILYGNDNWQMIYDTVKTAKFEIGVEYFAFEINDEEERKLRNLQRIFKSLPSTFHSPMRKAEPTSAPGTSDYELLVANWKRSLKLCAEFGSSHIVFHSNNCYIKEEERLIKQKNAMENCLFLNEMCKGYDVTLLVETLALPGKGAPIFTNEEYVDFILENGLYALIDVGHMNVNNYDYEYTIRKLNRRILAYHIHNNDGTDDTHQSIENGTFDYDFFIEMYKKYTPEADLVFEYINIPDLTAEKLFRDIDYLYQRTKE